MTGLPDPSGPTGSFRPTIAIAPQLLAHVPGPCQHLGFVLIS